MTPAPGSGAGRPAPGPDRLEATRREIAHRLAALDGPRLGQVLAFLESMPAAGGLAPAAPEPAAPLAELDVKTLLAQAQLMLRGKDWRGALARFEQAVIIHPELTGSLAVFRATCFLKIGLPEIALRVIRGLDVTRVAAREAYLLGKLLFDIRVFDLAERFVMRVVRSDPTHENAKDLLQKMRAQYKKEPDPMLALARKRFSPMIVEIQPYMSGGMAFIYIGYHQKLKRRIAIKVLRPTFVGVPDAVDRFLLEAVTLINLSHPNLLDVISLYKDEQLVSYVMEYLEGAETTEQRVRSRGPYPWTEALKIYVAATDALSVCHAKHVTHRDVKPDNILILPDERIKVIDLGAAEFGGGRDTQKANVFAGNLRYSPPESLSRSLVGPPGDVYALAVTFHDLVMGIQDSQATMPPDPTTFPEEVEVNLRSRGVSRLLLNILLRSLKHKPQDRYQDARALREALGTLPLVGPPAEL